MLWALSKHHDLWVITEQEKFEPEIEQELQRRPHLHQRITFHYIRKRRARKLRKLWPPSYYWFYNAWQRKAYQLAKKLHREVRFDVVHQLNIITFREPGYLWKLDAPFVWGPVDGAQNYPWSYGRLLGFSDKIFYAGRNLVNEWQKRTKSRPRLAAASAKHI